MHLQRFSFSVSLMLAAIGAVSGCASDPADDNWVGPEAGWAPEGSPVAVNGQLKVVGTEVQNESGVAVQLKGVSSNWLSFGGAYAESKSALEYMRDNWKLSVIRAAMPGEEGGYLTSSKDTVLRRAERIVRNAIDTGVYVIMDFHSHKAHLYQAGSIEFFTYMAKKYGAYPNVIWETYNEPANETLADGSRRNFTWADIKPYHIALVDAIRAEDPDNLIVLGTPIWSQFVDEAAKDPVAGTNLLYTLHFYACTHKADLRARGDAALAAGVALFVTEFGMTPADGGVSPNNYVCRTEGDLWFDWMAQHKISGASWKLDICNDASCLLKLGAGFDGPWPDDKLSTDEGGATVSGGTRGGHGKYVVDWIRK